MLRFAVTLRQLSAPSAKLSVEIPQNRLLHTHIQEDGDHKGQCNSKQASKCCRDMEPWQPASNNTIQGHLNVGVNEIERVTGIAQQHNPSDAKIIAVQSQHAT